MTHENFKEYMKERQFDIPHKLNYLSKIYPNITWNNARRIYREVVENILSDENIEVITDMPLGKGFLVAERMFEIKLKEDQKR